MHHVTRAVLVAAALWADHSAAFAYVEVSGVFVAHDRCQALDSIRRETNPGNILTVPGQSYTARGLNREDGDYIHVDVPGAVPRLRWVGIACGDLFREADEPRRPAEPATAFLPFF